MSVSETNAETAIDAVTVSANSRNSRPTMPPISSSGMKTATSETLIDRTVKPISRDPFERRLERRAAALDVAIDVLDHDDGVVDHEADRDGQRHQRQIVEAEAEEIHRGERADERQRHGRRSGSPSPRCCAGTAGSPCTTSPTVSASVNSTSCDRGADGLGAVERWSRP